jgi:RNA polymerase primary sigma factor
MPRKKSDTVAQDATINNANDLVYLYLREIGRTPLLSAKQEVELTKAMRRGWSAEERLQAATSNSKKFARLKQIIFDGHRARRILVQSNLRLVVNLAKHYIGHGLSLLDLIQEGNLGLIRAVEKFDHRRGFKFSTHATWWIRQAITRAIGTHGHTPRLPAHTGQWLRCMERETHKLTQELGHEPNEEELAARLKMPRRKVRRLKEASAPVLSFEMEIGGDPDTTLADFVEDETSPSPLMSAVESALRDDMTSALELLTPREARVLILRFGLRDGQEQTLEEVGAKFGLTRERIRQIEQCALGKLRAKPRVTHLDGYLESGSARRRKCI